MMYYLEFLFDVVGMSILGALTGIGIVVVAQAIAIGVKRNKSEVSTNA